MCGQQSKGRADKQAGSWASTGQMSLGNHLIASCHAHVLACTHTLRNPLYTHTHTFLNLSLIHGLTDPTGGQQS